MFVHPVPSLSNDLQGQLYEYFAPASSRKDMNGVNDRDQVTKGQVIASYDILERRLSRFNQLTADILGTGNRLKFDITVPFNSMLLFTARSNLMGATIHGAQRPKGTKASQIKESTSGIFCAFASREKHDLSAYTIYKPFFDAVRNNQSWFDESLKRGMGGRDWKTEFEQEEKFAKSIICEPIPWAEYTKS